MDTVKLHDGSLTVLEKTGEDTAGPRQREDVGWCMARQYEPGWDWARQECV